MNTTNDNNLNSRLKAYRKRLGLTQQQLADALSMTRSNYAHLEKNGNPSPDVLIKFSSILKISVDEILGNPAVKNKNEKITFFVENKNKKIASHDAFDPDYERKVNAVMNLSDDFTQLDPVEKELILNYRIMHEPDRKKVINLIKKLRNS